MKVALLFFGQPRFIDSPINFNSINTHILSKYDVDVFAHTWYTEGEESYSASTNVKGEDMPVCKEALTLIRQLYNPKVFISEPQKNFLEDEPFVKDYIIGMINHKRWNEYSWKWTPEHREPRNYFNMVSALYSCEKVKNIFNEYKIKTDTHYDFIIMTRYDIYIKEFPDLNILKNDKFYISDIHPNWPDELFITPYKYINAFNTYTFLKESVLNKSNFIDSIDRCSTEFIREICFYNYYSKENVSPINIRTSILRGKYILNYGDKLI